METSEHTNIHNAHPRSLINLQEIVSKEQPIKIVPKPTKRFLKKMELDYQYCPDCESREIIFSGKANNEKQRFKCKGCGYQFVSQFDAIFPRSKRRDIFEEEFFDNIKPTGFDKVGKGKKKYWSGVRMEVLQMLESRIMRVHANKIIKADPIRSDRDYKVLLEFLVHEAYNRVTG